MAVRKNLDELKLSDAIMFGAKFQSDGSDNEALDVIIGNTLPEAINQVNLSAPVELLEGISLRPLFEDDGVIKSDYSVVGTAGKVLYFGFSGSMLRIVKMQAFDSEHVVTSLLTESSAEGRKQLNPFVRGSYDRPSLVLLQGGGDNPKFRYYSLKEEMANFSFSRWLKMDPTMIFPILSFEYVPMFKYMEPVTEYPISTRLYESVISTLTAMVLAIYGESDRAAYFINQAKATLGG